MNILSGGWAHNAGEVSHDDCWTPLGRDMARRYERCEHEQRPDEGQRCEASAHEAVPRFRLGHCTARSLRKRDQLRTVDQLAELAETSRPRPDPMRSSSAR